MQPTRGGEVNRLARFRSAPATWLDTLLEEEEGEEEDDDSLKPTQSLTQLLAGSGGPAGGSGGYIPASDPSMFDGAGAQGFLRQSSLPTEFLSQINSSEGYFSSFGIPAGFDYAASPAVDGSPTGKRARELESRSSSRKFSSQSVIWPGFVRVLVYLLFLLLTKRWKISGVLDLGLKNWFSEKVFCFRKGKFPFICVLKWFCFEFWGILCLYDEKTWEKQGKKSRICSIWGLKTDFWKTFYF